MVMFSPLSRLCRQLSQRESQVPRVMHYTERCIEARPRYLFDKFRFAGEFGSIVSYGRINYKNSHSSAHCCGCSLPYEHRPLAGDLFSGRSRGAESFCRSPLHRADTTATPVVCNAPDAHGIHRAMAAAVVPEAIARTHGGLVAAPRAQRLNARRRRRRPRRSTSRGRAANRSSHSRPPCPRPSAPDPDAGVPT